MDWTTGRVIPQFRLTRLISVDIQLEEILFNFAFKARMGVCPRASGVGIFMSCCNFRKPGRNRRERGFDGVTNVTNDQPWRLC